jgi:hypothetical protein
MFKKAGQRLSSELDEVTPCLLRKAGEMSTAGRDNFLGQYADVALSQMVLSCPDVYVAKALMAMCALLSSVPCLTCFLCAPMPHGVALGFACQESCH